MLKPFIYSVLALLNLDQDQYQDQPNVDLAKSDQDQDQDQLDYDLIDLDQCSDRDQN